MKLKELQERMAYATKTPLSRVRSVAAELRVNGLITSGPRGPGAPDMTPTDVANLLFGIMYDAEVAESAKNVAILRRLRLARVEKDSLDEDNPLEIPNLPYLKPGANNEIQFGEFVDGLLEHLAKYGVPDAEPNCIDDFITSMMIKITSPYHSAEIYIDSDKVLWELEFCTDEIIKAREGIKVSDTELRPMLGIYSTRWTYVDALQALIPLKLINWSDHK